MHTQSAVLAFAIFSGLAMGACQVSRPNPEHCFYAHGDETCAEIDPRRPFCVAPTCSSEAYGCVAELPMDPSCQSPCGGALTSCIEMADDSGSEANEGDTQPDLPAKETNIDYECHSHAECPPDAGFCFFGACTPCDGTSDPDSACHVLTDGQAPVCLDGNCVQCTEGDVDECIESASTCDAETHTCVPCTAHDQCPGGAACDLPLGTCLPADAVFHVDGDGGQDFTSLGAAMAALDGGSGTLIIHELGQGDGYMEGAVISGDRTVALFGADSELPWLILDGVAIEVSNGARLHARRLVVTGLMTPVSATADSYLDLDSCAISGWYGDALRLDDSDLHMRNTMLVSEDGNVPLRIIGPSHVDVAYSTLLMFGPDPAVHCTGSTTVGSTIRNSALLNADPTSATACSGLPLHNNVVDHAILYNTSVGDFDTSWFTLDQFPGDTHLSNLAPVAFSNTAVWQPGDPTTDFDGDPRPTEPGHADFAGADRIP